MSHKFRNSGYKCDEISLARENVMKLNRDTILSQSVNGVSPSPTNQMIFTVNRNQFMATRIKKIIREYQEDIDELVGTPTRLVVAERRNANIASLLFAKSSFSREKVEPKITQKCNSENGCMTCKIMNLPNTVILWENHPRYQIKISLDFRCDCSSEYILYLYICKWCKNKESFYVGQSVNTCRQRANGHRAKFTDNLYSKSALSCHIFRDHPGKVKDKLKNYDLGVIKATSPADLDRLEDYYVDITHAKLSLNRYKPTR